MKNYNKIINVKTNNNSNNDKKYIFIIINKKLYIIYL